MLSMLFIASSSNLKAFKPSIICYLYKGASLCDLNPKGENLSLLLHQSFAGSTSRNKQPLPYRFYLTPSLDESECLPTFQNHSCERHAFIITSDFLFDGLPLVLLPSTATMIKCHILLYLLLFQTQLATDVSYACCAKIPYTNLSCNLIPSHYHS